MRLARTSNRSTLNKRSFFFVFLSSRTRCDHRLDIEPMRCVYSTRELAIMFIDALCNCDSINKVERENEIFRENQDATVAIRASHRL